MNLVDWIGLLISLGVFMYLVVALLYPEKF